LPMLAFLEFVKNELQRVPNNCLCLQIFPIDLAGTLIDKRWRFILLKI
jgi:hypothetical protein